MTSHQSQSLSMYPFVVLEFTCNWLIFHYLQHLKNGGVLQDLMSLLKSCRTSAQLQCCQLLEKTKRHIVHLMLKKFRMLFFPLENSGCLIIKNSKYLMTGFKSNELLKCPDKTLLRFHYYCKHKTSFKSVVRYNIHHNEGNSIHKHPLHQDHDNAVSVFQWVLSLRGGGCEAKCT